MAAANAFWPVFWMPSARPAQDDPACSATAVKARPLVLTETITAANSTATAHGARTAAPAASAARISAVATASARIGRIRLPTRSDHTPAPSRENAPHACATARIRPAVTGSSPCASTRKTRANVATAN